MDRQPDIELIKKLIVYRTEVNQLLIGETRLKIVTLTMLNEFKQTGVGSLECFIRRVQALYRKRVPFT